MIAWATVVIVGLILLIALTLERAHRRLREVKGSEISIDPIGGPEIRISVSQWLPHCSITVLQISEVMHGTLQPLITDRYHRIAWTNGRHQEFADLSPGLPRFVNLVEKNLKTGNRFQFMTIDGGGAERPMYGPGQYKIDVIVVSEVENTVTKTVELALWFGNQEAGGKRLLPSIPRIYTWETLKDTFLKKENNG